MSAPLAAILAFAAAGSECPALLQLHVQAIAAQEMERAQAYADCVARPWLPTSDVRAAKLLQCADKRSAAPTTGLAKALDWVDAMSKNFPGCELRLEIMRK